MKEKLTPSQKGLIYQMYQESGKKIDKNKRDWIDNLPKTEATKLISIWINKRRRIKA